MEKIEMHASREYNSQITDFCGQNYGLAGTGSCCWNWQCKFNPGYPHGGTKVQISLYIVFLPHLQAVAFMHTQHPNNNSVIFTKNRAFRNTIQVSHFF